MIKQLIVMVKEMGCEARKPTDMRKRSARSTDGEVASRVRLHLSTYHELVDEEIRDLVCDGEAA